MEMMELQNLLVQAGLSDIVAAYIMQYVSATPWVVLGANIITAITPTKLRTKSKKQYVKNAIAAGNFVLDVLNKLSFNILKNQNKDA